MKLAIWSQIRGLGFYAPDVHEQTSLSVLYVNPILVNLNVVHAQFFGRKTISACLS